MVGTVLGSIRAKERNCIDQGNQDTKNYRQLHPWSRREDGDDRNGASGPDPLQKRLTNIQKETIRMFGISTKRRVLSVVTGIVIATGAYSANAAQIYTESFAGGLQANTAIINGGNDGNGNFWAVLPSGSLDIGYTVSGIDISSFFGFRDINGSFGSGPPRAVEIQALDISMFTNVKLTIALSSRKDGSTNFEASDILNIKASVDGGGFATLESFFGTGAVDVGLKNTAGTELTTTLTDFMFNISADSSLAIRIDAENFDGGNEAAAFDNIRITGDRIATSQIPEPATLAIFGLGLAGLGYIRRKRAA
ncbi:MAG: PEP-CTERM sorting domain-containing protein [Planctomycetota bacterium]|nr:PEP-CTERM sorting domain-containing protein [Planctomycetota bacterium]